MKHFVQVNRFTDQAGKGGIGSVMKEKWEKRYKAANIIVPQSTRRIKRAIVGLPLVLKLQKSFKLFNIFISIKRLM